MGHAHVKVLVESKVTLHVCLTLLTCLVCTEGRTTNALVAFRMQSIVYIELIPPIVLELHFLTSGKATFNWKDDCSWPMKYVDVHEAGVVYRGVLCQHGDSPFTTPEASLSYGQLITIFLGFPQELKTRSECNRYESFYLTMDCHSIFTGHNKKIKWRFRKITFWLSSPAA